MNKSIVFARLQGIAFLLDVASAAMDQVRLEDSLPRWLTNIAGKLMLAVSWELKISSECFSFLHKLLHESACASSPTGN